MTIFCENLRHLRTSHHLSQQSLSKKLHVSLATVGRWERDLSFPPVEKLLDIAAIFNVSLDKLVGQEPKQVLDIYGLTETQQHLFIHLSRMFDAECISDEAITKTSILNEAFHIYREK